MEKNKTYKVVKSFKIDSTSGFTIDLKDKLIEYRSELPSFYIVTVEKSKHPLLISKSIDSKIEEVEYRNLNDKYDLFWTIGYIEPITEEGLLSIGFEKKASMYLKDGYSLQLIQGHTWHYCKVGEKFGKDVKYLEDVI